MATMMVTANVTFPRNDIQHVHDNTKNNHETVGICEKKGTAETMRKQHTACIYSRKTEPIMEQMQSARRERNPDNNADAVRSVGPIKGSGGVRCRGGVADAQA